MRFSEKHASKRHTRLGVWFPLFLYAVNYVLWLLTGILVGVTGLFWLAIIPLVVPLLYLYRAKRLSG